MSISFEEFQKLKIKVGTVVDCKPHPNAKNLLLLQTDIGDEEPIQLVAGLRNDYSSEQLIESQIVVITNLEPAKIRGEKSEGMLLAADAEDCISLLEPDRKVAPGTSVR